MEALKVQPFVLGGIDCLTTTYDCLRRDGYMETEVRATRSHNGVGHTQTQMSGPALGISGELLLGVLDSSGLSKSLWEPLGDTKRFSRGFFSSSSFRAWATLLYYLSS